MNTATASRNGHAVKKNRGRPRHKDRKTRDQLAAENVIVFLRSRNGMSQQQLAYAAGLTLLDISKLERKDFRIQLCKILTLAKHLGITPEAILHDRFDLVLPTLHSAPVYNQARRNAQRKAQITRLDNGYRGENLVAEKERMKLAGTVYENAVDPNYALDSTNGFDVLSFTASGEFLYIEVKTTNDKDNTPFFISANEKEFFEFCLKTGRHYELHRIYDIDGTPKQVVYTPEMLSRCSFTATEYLVKEQ